MHIWVATIWRQYIYVDSSESRSKTCECPSPPCFPCVGGPCNATELNPGECRAESEDHRTFNEIEECPVSLCPFGKFSDESACVFQSSCCQTLHVKSNSVHGVDGYYSRVFLDKSPFATYKLVSSIKQQRYIHFTSQQVFYARHFEK